MQLRSSDVGQNIGAGITAGADKGIGIALIPASTGSTATIQTLSDDTNANLRIAPQGAGTLDLGTSSNGVRISASSFNIASSQVRIGSTASSIVFGNSTSFWTAISRVRVNFTPPELAANAASDETTGSTNTLFTTSAMYVFTPQNAIFSTKYSIGPVYCSSAGDLRIRFSNNAASTIGTGESTHSGSVLIFEP